MITQEHRLELNKKVKTRCQQAKLELQNIRHKELKSNVDGKKELDKLMKTFIEQLEKIEFDKLKEINET